MNRPAQPPSAAPLPAEPVLDPHPPALAPARIELAIEEVVLHGFPAQQRHAIRDSLERELTILLGRPGGLPLPLASARQQDQLALGPVHLGARPSPATIGKRLARAIIGGLSQ